MPESDKPMVFDALPAYKVRHFCGKPAAGKLYCYMRMYGLNGGINMSLYAFERNPGGNSRIGVAAQCEGSDLIYLCVSPQQATAHRLTGLERAPQQAETAELMVTMPVSYTEGADEQGWYWGAQLSFSESLLAAASFPKDARAFRLALYKYHMGEKAFGASIPLVPGQNPLDPVGFDSFILY